jgi:hypothetical protein
LEEFGWVERLGEENLEKAAAMEMGAGMGEEEKGGNCWGGLPHEFK